MSARAASILAWSLFGLFVLLGASTLALVVFAGGAADGAMTILAVGYALVGALVVSRQPTNTVGWLLLGIALSFALGGFVDTYLTTEANPGRVAAAWVSTWVWSLWLAGALLFLPLVFPDGRLLSRRWRVVVGIDLAPVLLDTTVAAFAPGPLNVESDAPIQNPLGVGGVVGEAIRAVEGRFSWLYVVALAFSIVAVFQRLRGSRGRERAQAKWFAYVVVLALFGMCLAMAGELAGTGAGWVRTLGDVGWFSAALLISVGLPIAVGIAVLRHRLFDIDLVINRTLVYGALTATLAASYLGCVLLLQVLLGPLTRENDLAIAVSTLAVAALFRPARSRIQAVVDRRFYRERYDASRTLETFALGLRDEIDLDALGTDLRRVVRDSMHPAHVSLWMRQAPR